MHKNFSYRLVKDGKHLCQNILILKETENKHELMKDDEGLSIKNFLYNTKLHH